VTLKKPGPEKVARIDNHSMLRLAYPEILMVPGEVIGAAGPSAYHLERAFKSGDGISRSPSFDNVLFFRLKIHSYRKSLVRSSPRLEPGAFGSVAMARLANTISHPSCPIGLAIRKGQENGTVAKVGFKPKADVHSISSTRQIQRSRDRLSAGANSYPGLFRPGSPRVPAL